MTTFQVVFASSVDLDETDYYTRFALAAATLADAESEARALPPPPGANLMKILRDGDVLERIWLPTSR